MALRTTTGRVWGYIGVFTGLSVSLAGNVAATYLNDAKPDKVDILAAGLPPFAVFIAIELLSRNPWRNAPTWGPLVQKVVAIGVAPPAAIISFIHLVHLTIDGKTEDPFAWAVAILTPLMIDGLLVGSTAALLLPKNPASVVPPEGVSRAQTTAAFNSTMAAFTRSETERKVDSAVASVLAHEAVPNGQKVTAVRARLAPQRPRTGHENGLVERKRYKPREHPLWAAWLAAKDAGAPWSPDEMVQQAKTEMGKDMSVPAAATMIGRWEKELVSPST